MTDIGPQIVELSQETTAVTLKAVGAVCESKHAHDVPLLGAYSCEVNLKSEK